MATSGVGSNQHVLCEWFKREAGIKIDHVPYRGAGQAINDLVAAHVKIGVPRADVDDPALEGRHAQSAGAIHRQAQSDAAGNPDA